MNKITNPNQQNAMSDVPKVRGILGKLKTKYLQSLVLHKMYPQNEVFRQHYILMYTSYETISGVMTRHILNLQLEISSWEKGKSPQPKWETYKKRFSNLLKFGKREWEKFKGVKLTP